MAKYKTKEDNDGCCSITFLKWVLIVYTVILCIAGCLIVGVSLWTVFDSHQYVALLASITYPTIVYLLLAAGVLLILVSILGFIAVAKESRRCLVIYIFLLLLIFVTEVTVGILSFVYSEQVHYILESNLNDKFSTLYGIDDSITTAVDFLQEEFTCCGVDSYKDWSSSVWLQDGISNINLVPDTCCKTITTDCGHRTHPSNIYSEGCLGTMEEHMKSHLNILSAVGLGICVLQIFGIVYAFTLYCKLRHVFDVRNNRKRMEMQALFS